MQFDALPVDVQQRLSKLDEHIRQQLRAAEMFDLSPVETGARQIGHSMQDLQQSMALINNIQARDKKLIDAVSQDVHRSFRDTETGARAFESYQAPTSVSMHAYTNVTHEYFLRVMTSMEARADQYNRDIDDIERHVTMAAREPITSPQAVNDVIRNQTVSLWQQAARAAKLHDGVQRMQARYKDWRRRTYGDERDPFAKRQRLALSDDKAKEGGLGAKDLDNLKCTDLREMAASTLNPINKQLAPAAPAASGLFGQSAASVPAMGGLFGQPASAAPAAGGMFGQPASVAPAAGGLFGQPASAAPAAGGLFGQPASAAPAAGGMFGQPTSAAPFAGGNMFAQTKPGFMSGTSAPTVTATPGSSIFGNPAGTAAPAAGGLFGQTAAPAMGGGMFGQTAAASVAPATGGLFGQASAAAPTGGLFGQPAATGGGNLFGQPLAKRSFIGN